MQHLLEKEEAIAQALPRNGAMSDRERLLSLLSSYSHAVVAEARLHPILPPVQQSARALAWLERPIFICGHHRSGTTLLQQLLDGHPEIAVLPSEGTYFTSFAYAARKDTNIRGVDRFVAEWVSRLVDPNYEPHFKLGRTRAGASPMLEFAQRLLGWRERLMESRPDLASFSLLLALIAAFKDVGETSKTPRLWAEKTPLNENNVARLARFERARFIHMVRNPAATLSSLAAQYRSAEGSAFCPPLHARRLARSLALATSNAERYPDRYLVVRYENLLDHRADEIERLCNFLGVFPHASLFIPTVCGIPAGSNSSFQRGAKGSIEAAPERPVASDVELAVKAYAGAAARALGYEIARLSIPRECIVKSRLFAHTSRVMMGRLLTGRRVDGCLSRARAPK